jgi:glycosyltransferase involved in cell wall biosynthesis
VRGFVDSRVELYELPWERRSAREQLDAARELRSLVSRWQPDVVHLHSSFAGVVGALSLRRSLPSIYTPHGYSFTMLDRSRPRRFAFRMLERFTASRVNLVGAVSEAEADDGRRVAAAEKVTVVRNGIPELDDPAAGDAIPAVRPRVVTIGRIVKQHMPPATARILASGVRGGCPRAGCGGHRLAAAGRGAVATRVLGRVPALERVGRTAAFDSRGDGK